MQQRLKELSDALEAFFSDPRKTLAFSMALGALFVALAVIFCVDTYRDVAFCYGYLTAEFGKGHFMEALRPELPPLPIAMPGLLCLLGLDAFHATEIVSGLFYVLTVLPLYFLMKSFMEGKYAAWGCLLYILCPKIIRFSYSGLPDTYRNFFVVLALAIVLGQLARPRWWKMASFGAVLAGISFARGEGIALAAFITAVYAALLLRKEWQAGRKIPALAGSLFKDLSLAGLLFLLCMAPRCYQNYLACGYPVPDSRIVMCLKARMQHDGPPRQEKQAYIESKKPLSQIDANIRGAYELYAILACIGVFLALKRRQWRMEYNILFAIMLCNALVFSTIVVSYRYYLINMPLLLPFTMIGFLWGLSRLAALGAKPWMIAILLAGIGSAQVVDGIGKAFSTKYSYEKRSGEWVRDNQQLFPHTGRDGAFRVVGDSVLSFWTGGEYALAPGRKQLDLNTCEDFDVAIFRVGKTKDNLDPVKIFEGRADVEEIPNPYSNKVRVYRKKAPASGVEPHGS